MLKLTLLDFSDGSAHTKYGTEEELKAALRYAYPAVRGMFKLSEMADYLNEHTDVEVHVGEVENDNLLPEGYWYKDQNDYEEPWVRESHFHEEENADHEPDPSDSETVRLGLKP